MPRKKRFFLPGVAAHVIQRGNNRQAVFREREDYCCYLKLLGEARHLHGCAIHTYVLMTNHVHLLVTPEEACSISRLMQHVGRAYVPYFNKKYARTGTLWDGRFKANIVDSAAYLLACQRYIELNPVRAGLVTRPVDYRWSGYCANALGRKDELLDAHTIYLGLGDTDATRCKLYRQMVDEAVDDDEVTRIREFVKSGTPLGSRKFRDEIEHRLSISIGQARPGRPRKVLSNELEKGI